MKRLGDLVTHGLHAADVLIETANEAPRAPANLTVNGRFDWAFAALMPGCVIEALPPPSAGLQYRFVDGDLALVDGNAGLIVDVLPRALSTTSSAAVGQGGHRCP